MSKKVHFSLFTPWKHIGGVEVELHSFINSSIFGGKWLRSRFKSKKEKWYLLNSRGLGGPQIRSGSFGRREKFLPRTSVRTQPHPARSVVSIPTRLYRITNVIICGLRQRLKLRTRLNLTRGEHVKSYTGRNTVSFRVINEGLLCTYCQILVANLWLCKIQNYQLSATSINLPGDV